MTTRDKPPWAETNEIMLRAGLPAAQIRLAHIWAAKHRACEKCNAKAYSPCRNLSDIKAKIKPPRKNKDPHTERIDFHKLKTALHERGYK